MEPATLTLIVAVGGWIVASASLATNIFLAWLLRTKTPTVSLIQEARDALRSVVDQFDNSSIFTVSPNDEVWCLGFKSLSTIRSTISTANTVIKHSRSDLVPQNIRDIVSNTLVEVQKVYEFNDKFAPIQKGRDWVPPAEVIKWKHKAAAEAALTTLQSYVRQNRNQLELFLKSL